MKFQSFGKAASGAMRYETDDISYNVGSAEEEDFLIEVKRLHQVLRDSLEPSEYVLHSERFVSSDWMDDQTTMTMIEVPVAVMIRYRLVISAVDKSTLFVLAFC